MSGLTRDGTAEPVSQDQIPRGEQISLLSCRHAMFGIPSLVASSVVHRGGEITNILFSGLLRGRIHNYMQGRSAGRLAGCPAL